MSEVQLWAFSEWAEKNLPKEGVWANMQTGGYINPPATDQLPINEWSQDEWLSIPGVGAVLAERLTQSAPYQRIEDIKGVKGVTGKIVTKVQEIISSSCAASDESSN